MQCAHAPKHAHCLALAPPLLARAANFQVEWPQGLTDLQDSVSSFFQLNFIELPKVACLFNGLNFRNNLILNTATPIIIVALFALPLLVVLVIARVRGWTPARHQTYEALKDRFFNNVLFGAFLIYPTASLQSLQAFNCHPTLGVIGVDFTLECPELVSFLGLYSVVCILIFPLGIPVLFWSLMKEMKVPDIARDKKMRAAFSDMLSLFNKMTSSLECKLIAQTIGGVEPYDEQCRCRVRKFYEHVAILKPHEHETLSKLDLHLHKCLAMHFHLEPDETVPWPVFERFVIKLVKMTTAFTGLESIDRISNEQVMIPLYTP